MSMVDFKTSYVKVSVLKEQVVPAPLTIFQDIICEGFGIKQTYDSYGKEGFQDIICEGFGAICFEEAIAGV